MGDEMTDRTGDGVGRRSVLMGGAAVGALALSPFEATPAVQSFFQHGVASGDPEPHSVVLWTRLTPTPAATPGSGRGPRSTVRWQVARDRRFERVVAAGTFVTDAGRDHTVKVLAVGLAPHTSYYYRFLYRHVSSEIGRTRTSPAANEAVPRLRFGVVSCANLQAGYFSAYRHLAERDDLDAVLHLGDYIYEYAPGEYGYGYDNLDVRRHSPPHEMLSLSDYRRRHAQYKSDPDLRALHARLPFVVCWDDHDVANDAYRGGAQNHTSRSEGPWAARRERARHAYDEWMPVRLQGTSRLGDGARLYRSLRFGSLAELCMLDLRSYRSRQVRRRELGRVDAPGRTITGDQQMTWLKRRLASSRAQWKLVGNPVMIAPVAFPPLPDILAQRMRDVAGFYPDDGLPINVDQWDGYTADRGELLHHLRRRGVQNTVFLTGDIHSAWACDLPVARGSYPRSGSIGTEFVCTSVTSNNLDDITGIRPRTASLALEAAIQRANRHVKFVNLDDHGFSVLDVTAHRVQMDYYVVGDRRQRNARASWAASWATDAGTQLVHPVSRPV